MGDPGKTFPPLLPPRKQLQEGAIQELNLKTRFYSDILATWHGYLAEKNWPVHLRTLVRR